MRSLGVDSALREAVWDGVVDVYLIVLGYLRAAFKDENFDAEREVRFVFHELLEPTMQKHHRATASTVIPYLSISLGHNLQEEFLPTVREVCVGPNPNAELNERALKEIFPPRRLADGRMVERVSTSAIPYRSWL